jgi:Mrp family chromosome partitioning ATPase
MERLEKVILRGRRGRDVAVETEDAWRRLKSLSPDRRTLARARIVTSDKTNPLHTPFDMLRTRLVRVLQDRGWRSVAVTSPTPGCGKTTTCLNLAFSLARRRGGRTMLVELDLVKPAIARLLGAGPERSIADMLTGVAEPESCFLRIGQTLAVGLATGVRRNSAEILQSAECAEAILRAATLFAPDVILYDLPPVFAVDDALGFAPKADCALIVAAEGQSAVDEIDACVTQLSRVTEVLGVVLTKSAFPRRGGHGYYGYGYGYGG